MINFDAAAGTHFEGKEVVVTNHAMNEAVADFRVPEDEARSWVREQLRKAQFIGTIYDERGVQTRLFGYQRIAFIVAIDTDVVITVYARHKVDANLRNPIEEIVRTTVDHMNGRLAAVEASATKVIAGYRLGLEAADRAVEAGALSGAMEWRTEMEELIRREEEQLAEVRQEHARLMKGVVAYV